MRVWREEGRGGEGEREECGWIGREGGVSGGCREGGCAIRCKE